MWLRENIVCLSLFGFVFGFIFCLVFPLTEIEQKLRRWWNK